MTTTTTTRTPPESLLGEALEDAATALVFDVQTTGLSTANDRIASLAFIRYMHGEKHKTFSQRFRPSTEAGGSGVMQSEAVAVHGITANELVDEPPFVEYAAAIKNHFARADCLVGYNVRFDIDILQAEWERVGMGRLDISGKSI